MILPSFNPPALLLAQVAEAPITRTSFEWGRIQSETDWLLPLSLFAALVVYAWWMYRRDAADLHPAAGIVLGLLRTATLAALLLIYLQPQWRNEQDVVTNSRAVLLVDTSLSMGLHDTDDSPVPAEPNRAQQVIDALRGPRLLDELRRRHDVVVSRFDQDVGRVALLPKRDDQPAANDAAATTPEASGNDESATDWETILAPRGGETRLGQALRQVIEEESAAPLSGIVVFTDGQQNAGVEPAAAVELARQARVPIYAVGLGSDRHPVNVRASDLMAPARAYPGDSYTVTGFIQSQGLIGTTVTVELWSRAGDAPAGGVEGKLEATEQVTLGGDGEVLPVKFNLRPTDVGRRTLRLQVKPPPQDRNETDNVQEADIEIVDRKTRVLLFAGGATREYQFLRDQLRRDKHVLVDVLLQTGWEGVSQDADQILEEFPTTREEMYAYDCLVAFDPDWRQIGAAGIDLVDRWISEQAGGMIVVPGPVHTDAWVQDAAMDKMRNLYPVQFNRRFSLLDDGRFGSREPWPLQFSREGLEAEFLWLVDSSAANAHAWSEFAGVYGYYAVRGPKPGATVYARYSDPRSADGGQLPVYFASQFSGSGRVFYMGSGEMWRLRARSEGYFERLYTQLIRYVSQGRLLRGSTRGTLLVERDRYLLGNTVEVRAQLSNAQLEPLETDQVALEVVLPDSTLATVSLRPDPSRVGNYRGQFPVRKEGVYRLELPVPESDDRLSRRIQVRVPDLERETPQRNDPLLTELAQRTDGLYYVGINAALGGTSAAPPVWDALRDQSRTTTRVARPEPLWDNWYALLLVCGCLCTEWLIRRLLKLA